MLQVIIEVRVLITQVEWTGDSLIEHFGIDSLEVDDEAVR